MKKLFALLAALLLVSVYAYSQDQTDNCYDEATGTFCVYVQQAIDVTGPEEDVCLGEICPGCSTIVEDEDCMVFVVTGGDECWVHVLFDGIAHPTMEQEYESEESDCVLLTGYWQYWDDNATPTWENFNSGSEHWTTNNWPLDQPGDQNDDPEEVQFRLCGVVSACCEADEGWYYINIGLSAEYVCPQI